MDPTQLLKQFVRICKENPAILHQPEYAFYREYLESLGAKIPPAPQSASEKNEKPADEPKSAAAPETKQTFEEHQEEEEPDMAPPELDNSGVIEDKTGGDEYPMGDPSKEVSEEDLEKANENRDIAAAAFAEGEYQKSLEHYTKAIELNPGSAILHAKRANTLMKMDKLRAAIKDCDKAIAINPDSAAPYKFRGRANRLLGNWLEAHKDLVTSCKLDYDDTAYEWLKEVEPNAKKLNEYQRAKDRHAEEKELRSRQERIRRAQEAQKRAAEEAKQNETGEEEEDFMGGGGGGFGMGPFSELFKELSDDPELLSALKNDPGLIQKLMEIMQNPANMMKHMGDPNVQKLLAKLGAKMGAGGAGGMPPGFMGGQSDANEGEQPTTAAGANTQQPKKAPEPDLD